MPAGHKAFSSDLRQGRGNFRSNSQPEDASQELHGGPAVVGGSKEVRIRVRVRVAIPSSTAPPDSVSAILGWSHT